MPEPEFNLTADFFFRSEDCKPIDVRGVVELIRRQMPTATVDFERGRLNVLENIERLKTLGTPEIIYRGEYQLLDGTICVEVPVPNRLEKLEGFTSGFSDYDGCIGLDCKPFHIDALKLGAFFVAESLDLDVSLVSRDYLEIGILCKQGNVAPQSLVAERFADLVAVSGTRDITKDWSSKLKSACVTWLNDHPETRTRERWLSVIRDGQTLWRSLNDRLASMGVIQGAKIVEFDREFWHSCLVLSYVDWTAMVNLSGHPHPLLDGR